MGRSPRYWILVSGGGPGALYIPPEGDAHDYTIAPNRTIKKGDVVYLWSNDYFYGWGEVDANPTHFIQVIQPETIYEQKIRRLSVHVKRMNGFMPGITAHMMRADRHLKNFIPTGFDDSCAVEILKTQANYLDDFIREHSLGAPKGSVTTNWLIEEPVPRIVVQTLLTFGDKTNEGQLVLDVRIPWFEILKIISRDPEEIYKIDPFKLEELIAGGYDRKGYNVILTPRSGDKGRDIIATKDGFGCIKIFDQVKRYKVSHPVTAEEVRALVGVISMDSSVSKGIITTTSTFSPSLLEDENIARLVPYRLELRPRDTLLAWLEGLRISEK